MKHYASAEFWSHYWVLPEEVRKQADQAFQNLKQDPKYPSLRFKKVGRFWSARVGAGYRALAVDSVDGLLWFWIGPHADYDKLLR